MYWMCWSFVGMSVSRQVVAKTGQVVVEGVNIKVLCSCLALAKKCVQTNGCCMTPVSHGLGSVKDCCCLVLTLALIAIMRAVVG